MTALYVAEARAHARALVRVARLEAAAALAPSKDDLASLKSLEARARAREGQGKGWRGGRPGARATRHESTPGERRRWRTSRRWRPSRRLRSGRDATTPGFRAAAAPPSDRRPSGRRPRGGGDGGGGRCGGDRLRPADHSALADAPQRPRRRVLSPDQPAHARSAGRA